MKKANGTLNMAQVTELLLQSLEHERGGVQVYETALKCVVTESLKKEWSEYLEQTKTHVATLEGVFAELGLDPEQPSPGRDVVRHLGKALVEAMQMAKKAADPAAAELVACECVVIAETKDHADWELISKCAERLEGDQGAVLKAACDKIEDQEDEHLYHSKGYCRELWLQSLGIPAIIPPPEEVKHVKTAIGASRAEQAGDKERPA